MLRRLVVIAHITLDGVIQGMGGRDEDTSGGFAHGGWVTPYADDTLSTAIRREMNLPFDLLLGRKTYDIWAPYWPHHVEIWPNVNAATKYVVSNTRTSGDWQPCVFLGGDVAHAVLQVKQQPGPDLHVYGSGSLVRTLMGHDLVDAVWLKIYPLVLGSGKRLFGGQPTPAAFRLTGSQVSPSGVIMAQYARAGATVAGRA